MFKPFLTLTQMPADLASMRFALEGVELDDPQVKFYRLCMEKKPVAFAEQKAKLELAWAAQEKAAMLMEAERLSKENRVKVEKEGPDLGTKDAIALLEKLLKGGTDDRLE